MELQTQFGIDEPRRTWPLAVGLGALFAVAVVVVPLCMLLTMASAACSTGDTELICGATGQLLVFFLPVAGILVALLVGAVGGGRAVTRRNSPAPWIAGAWLIFGICAFTAFAIAAGAP